jgi:MFS family permease
VFKDVAVASILTQSFFFGIIFYGYLYYLPLYFQNVRQFSVLKSAYLSIALVLTQSFASVGSGQYISRRKRYGECIWVGFTIIAASTGLTVLFNRTIPVYAIIIVLAVMGVGNGCVFQPTIIALQAHSPKSHRAIVISIRNFLRCLGGAIGLAVSAAILQSTLRASLPDRFQNLAHSVYSKPDYSKYSAEDTDIILGAYEKASRAVFIFYAPVAVICFLCCFFVRDRGLQRAEEVETNNEKETMDESSDSDVEAAKK